GGGPARGVPVRGTAAAPALPLAPVAVSTTLAVPGVVGVPEIVPVPASIDRPAGRFVADHRYGVRPPDAELASVTAVPTKVLWLPGLATVGGGGAPRTPPQQAPPPGGGGGGARRTPARRAR